MISRCIALLLSLSLAGCCASGVGCTTAAPSGPVAWDGLGAAPAENAVVDNAPSEGQKVRRNATRAGSRPQYGDRWEAEQASDQAADAKLNSQLKICSNC